jgi:NTE family protein
MSRTAGPMRIPARRREGERAGLVLGAGGVLGAAWMAGALAAIQARLPYPVEEIDVIVGSPRLILNSLRAPGRVHPWVTAAACLPRGRAGHEELRHAVSSLLAHRCHTDPAAPARGRTWITAVDYDSGGRVAFGRDGVPAATLPEAVAASCSVPGWYRPAVIGSHRYVDGGVRSPTNADLLARAEVTQAYVLAPAASLDTRPSPRADRAPRARRQVVHDACACPRGRSAA